MPKRAGPAPIRATAARSRARGAGATLARPTIAIGLLIVGLLLATAFVALAAQRNAMARETAALQADIQAQQARRARLEAGFAEKSGDSYVVDKAREYGYVKPGEALIGVKREPKSAVVDTPVASPSRAQRWIAVFFGAR